MLKAKFLCWLPPVAIVSSVIFGTGAYAIKASLFAGIFNVLAGLLISYGIAGTAIGLGAVFVNFTWEHSYQLAAGFGNFLFMLSSTFLIFLNTGFAAIAIMHAERAFQRLDPSSLVIVTLAVMAMIASNFAAARLAMKAGAATLKKMMNT